MKKIITLIILTVSISMGNSFAQKSAIGVRGGAANGLTFKTYKGSQSAFEFLLSTRWRGFNFTALAERYTSPFDEKQLRFYYGAGGHIGRWNDNYNPFYEKNGGYTLLGVDGIVGIEYDFEAIPFNLSLDWKPSFNLTPSSSFWYDEFGLSFRFTF